MLIRHHIAAPWRLGLRLARSFRQSPQGLRILLFHDIPRTDADAFERLVEYVVEQHGVVNPDEASAELKESRSPNRWCAPCVFSFDDGFISNSEIAAPILERHGVKGLFFACSGLTELSGDKQRIAIAKNIFDGRIDANSIPSDQRLMTWAELSGLQARGHTIGCHGMSHRRLTELNDAELEHEIIDAGDLMDERMGQKTEWYAYAFGDINSLNDAAMHKITNRFRFCRSGIRGLNGVDTTPMTFLADSLEVAAPLSYQKLLLEGALDFKYNAALKQFQKLDQF